MFPQEPNPPAARNSWDDTHTIETPEQMALEFSVAGVGSRFLAMAIDSLIQGAAAMAVLIIAGFAAGFGALGVFKGAGPWIVAIVIGILFLLYFGYFAIFEALWRGQTPGKRAAGIRVVKDSGRPLTAAEIIGRNLMRIVDQLPAFYGVGVLVAMLNAQNKRLGDFVAGSIVVRESSFADIKPIWHTSQTPPPAPGPPLGADRLSLEDLALIDTFLNRRHDLAPNVRARMADGILSRLKPKLTLQGVNEFRSESILESLAYERRSAGYN